VVLGAADGALELETIVPAGRKPMAAADWARGARLESGADWGVSS
jgi:methionyl-tRNA formyltransferase